MTSKTTKISLLLIMLVALGGAVSPARESIDSILEGHWKANEIAPAAPCTDGQFLRRASLDIIGRTPTLDELRSFLKNPDRESAVDALLRSEEFPKFWAEIWTAMLIGYRERRGNQANRSLRDWLKIQFENNRSWDEITTRLVAAEGMSNKNGAVNFLARNFFEPAIKVSRVFLGVRLDCARCHDHPFDRWTQDDYADFSRFFHAMENNNISRNVQQLRDNVLRTEGGEKPRFLTGSKPITTRWREELSLYMTKSKPFAKNFANRLWYHFMGRGIVNPPDDFNRRSRPSVPKLMTFLARQARSSRFNIRTMIRMIATSKAYQLSARRSASDVDLEKAFAYRVIKPLLPEQIYDSVVAALGRKWKDRTQFIRDFTSQRYDADYTNLWEYRESVQHVMRKLSSDLPVLDAPVEELFLRLYSRKPTDRERNLVAGRDTGEIIFALANSSEFYFNH